MPIMGMTTQCQGCDAAFVSLGRTSQPQVSAQIAAISVLRIHSAVSKRSPGALPPAYLFPICLRGLKAALHVPGPHDHKIAFAYLDALRGGAFFQFPRADAVTVPSSRVHSHAPGHVQEHAAADHFVLHLFDAVLVRAVGVHEPRVVTVPHFFAVENVAQSVPLRTALQRHGHHVVGISYPDGFLAAGHRVRPRRQHGVDGIEAVPPQAVLGPVAVKIERQRKHFSFADEARRVDDVLRRNIVQRPGFVVGAPSGPSFSSRSEAALWMSWSVTASFVFVMSLNPLWWNHKRTRSSIDYHEDYP